MNNDQLTSINRNILECKAYINSYAPGYDMVLIETYWNVKRILIVMHPATTWY